MSRMTVRLAKTAVAIVAAVALAGCPTGGGATLTISQVAFVFNSDATADTFTISNTGSGDLAWFVTADVLPDWLQLSPLEGTVSANPDGDLNGAQVVTMSLVEAEAEVLEPGLYREEFTVFSDGGNEVISVTLRVSTLGDLIVDPAEIPFGDITVEASFTIANGGDEALNWEIASIEPEDEWLSIATGSPREGTIPNSGSEPQTVRVAVNRNALEPDDYIGSIVVTSDGGTRTIGVTMSVTELAGELQVAPDELSFETDTQQTKQVVVRNTGTAAIEWSIKSNTGDLPDRLNFDVTSGDIAAGAAGDRLALTVDATNLDPATYRQTIVFSAVGPDNEFAGPDESLAVTLTVPIPIPKLEVITSLPDHRIAMAGQQTDDFFRIENAGTGVLVWTLAVSEDSGWIQIAEEDLSGSSDIDSGIVDFTIDRASLNPGTQVGTVTVSSSSDPAADPDVIVTIEAVVLPPRLEVVPDILEFDTNIVTRRILIFNSGVGEITWTIDTDDDATDPLQADELPGWLRRPGNGPAFFSKTSGVVSANTTDLVEISVNRNGLPPGNYAWPCTSAADCVAPGDFADFPDLPQIVIRGGTRVVPLRLFMSVSENPAFAVNTGGSVDLDGVAFVNVGLQTEADFTISNEGTGTLTWRIMPDPEESFPSWLTVGPQGPNSLASSDGDVPIHIAVNRTGLTAGSQKYTFHFITDDPDTPDVPVRVEMVVPPVPIIEVSPENLDFGFADTTADVFVANFGDDPSVLDFEVTSNKPWLFAFPAIGQSQGVADPELAADYQVVSVSIDRSGLSESGSGTGTLTIVALMDGVDDENNAIKIPDPSIEPAEILVSVGAAELFFEVAPARLRVPTQARYVMSMRNLRFGPITIPDDKLAEISNAFLLFEDNQAVELSETNYFVTSASNLRTEIAILLDYSGSAVESAYLAQDNHLAVLDHLVDEAAENGTGRDYEEFDGFAEAPDPLQFIYNATIGKLISELPEHYRIAIREFHDRDQEGQTVIGFTPNTVAGRVRLIEALEAINITDPGATELVPAIIDAATAIYSEDVPLPSRNPVVPIISFNDADVRGIIVVSDGRLTTGPTEIPDAVDALRGFRARLFAISWGAEPNPGPLATIAAETGGHLYVAPLLLNGPLLGEDTERVPGIETLYDWCSTDILDDDCDLSIKNDLISQLVLSYVSLSAEDTVASRTAATFNDPSDGRFPCDLPNQGLISGGFSQDIDIGLVNGNLSPFVAFPGGITNVAQFGMSTLGDERGLATVDIFMDYMPHDIRTMRFVFAANEINPDTAVSIDDINLEVVIATIGDGGVASTAWTLTGPVDSGIDAETSLDTVTYTFDLAGGPPIEYGLFGNLLRATMDVPGGTPFNFRLLSITGETGNDDVPGFTHPDGIPIAADEDAVPIDALAPSFPTARFSNTILDFFDSESVATFTIENIGGAFTEGGISLQWNVIGGEKPTEGVRVFPFVGNLATTADVDPVRVFVDRSAFDPGQLGATFDMRAATGIGGVVQDIPFVISGIIQDPVIEVVSGGFSPPDTQQLPFDVSPLDLRQQEEVVTVLNTGDSSMGFFRADDAPAWLDADQTGNNIVDPNDLPPGDTAVPFNMIVKVDPTLLGFVSPVVFPIAIQHDIVLVGTDPNGREIGRQTIRVIANVSPNPITVADIPDATVTQGSTYTGPTPAILETGAIPLAWTLVSGPAGMTINASTGVVSYPNASLTGSPHTVTIQANRTDNAATLDTETWLLTVAPLAIVDIPDDSVVEGDSYTGPTPASASPGAQTLTWSLVVGPAGMTISAATGVVSYPVASLAGSPHLVTIRAQNATDPAIVASESWLLAVLATSPVIQTISNITVNEGAAYVGPIPTLLQGGEVPVVWTLLLGPAGMTIDPATGQVTYPNASPAGSPYFITIKVANAEDPSLFDIISWQLTVTPTPVAPILAAIDDDTVANNDPYTGPTPVVVTGTLPVTFSLVQSAPGMTIVATTGVVSWSAADSTVGTVTIGIRVVNTAGTYIEFFDLTVDP